MPQTNRLSLPSASLKQQIASKINWNDVRSEGMADFFTIGYTGKKTEEILDTLKRHGVLTIMDIRHNPVSMYRPDFSKSNLSNILAKNGIAYIHAPQLGVPRDIRAKAIETGSRDIIWAWYDRHVVPYYLSLHAFINGFDHPVAFMCTEIDPLECHRHRLAVALEEMGLRSFDL